MVYNLVNATGCYIYITLVIVEIGVVLIEIYGLVHGPWKIRIKRLL